MLIGHVHTNACFDKQQWNNVLFSAKSKYTVGENNIIQLLST